MKNYYTTFGSGLPSLNGGLAPTLITFNVDGVTAIVAPGITETVSGVYRFQYGTTQSIFWTMDGGATLSATDRYVSGAIDTLQVVDEKVGTIDDSFGSTAVDPSTLFGHAKRNQEFNEGNATFDKATGIWDVSSRGSSVLLAEKTLTNSLSTADKS